MKLIIEKHALVAALAQVAPVAASKGTIAIIANVLLMAKDGKLTMRTTNLDMEIVAQCSAAIDTPGETTVNVARLFDIARNMPAGAQILFELGKDDPRMKVSSGRSRFMLPTVTAKDFPVLESQAYPTNMTMPAAELAASISRTSWAQSNEATRYYLCGTHLIGGNANLRFEASNGHVCAVSDMQDIDGDSDGVNVIVPSFATAVMSRLIDGLTGDVVLSASSTRISLAVGTTTFSTKVIDGAFPDITRIIPRANPHTMTVDADLLAGAVKRVSGVSDDKTPAVKLTVTANTLTITARGSDSEEGADEIECHYDGPEIRVSFSTEYIISAIAALNADALEVAMTEDGISPTLWRAVGRDADLAVLMPRRG